MRLRSYELASASPFGFSRKIRRPATFDFCNTICQKQTHAVQQSGSLFDHFVGALLEGQWHGEAKRLGGLEVDDQLYFRLLLNRQVGGLLALEDTAGVDASPMERIGKTAAVTEGFPWNDAPHYLVRDRDRVYGDIVTRRLRAMGIRDKPIATGSPWQNGFAERLIGSIRRECVDHFIVLGEAHLRQILRAYARYYNNIRTHRSLDKDAPVSRPVQRTGSFKSHALFGGLHHHYVRV